ncbi:hypothetical protein [Nostoc sp.]
MLIDDEVYGVIGEGYIHVDHLKPLSEIGKKYELNPILRFASLNIVMDG